MKKEEKIVLEDILPSDKYQQLINTANEITKITKKKLKLLIDFLEENRKKLEQRIGIDKYSDSTFKIKKGKRNEYYKMLGRDSIEGLSKLIVEKKREFYPEKGILVGENCNIPVTDKHLFNRSSPSYELIFYIPRKKYFLKVTKEQSSYYRGCFGGHIYITKTLGYKKIRNKEVIEKIDLLKLTKNLNNILIKKKE